MFGSESLWFWTIILGLVVVGGSCLLVSRFFGKLLSWTCSDIIERGHTTPRFRHFSEEYEDCGVTELPDFKGDLFEIAQLEGFDGTRNEFYEAISDDYKPYHITNKSMEAIVESIKGDLKGLSRMTVWVVLPSDFKIGRLGELIEIKDSKDSRLRFCWGKDEHSDGIQDLMEPLSEVSGKSQILYFLGIDPKSQTYRDLNLSDIKCPVVVQLTEMERRDGKCTCSRSGR